MLSRCVPIPMSSIFITIFRLRFVSLNRYRSDRFEVGFGLATRNRLAVGRRAPGAVAAPALPIGRLQHRR